MSLSPKEIADRWRAPMSRAQRARLRQIVRYLRAHWPTRKPIRLFVRRQSDGPDGSVAACTPSIDGRLFVIDIDNRACFFHALDLVLHEFAHARTYGVPGPHHGAAWAGEYAALVTAFEDGDAFEESKTW